MTQRISDGQMSRAQNEMQFACNYFSVVDREFPLGTLCHRFRSSVYIEKQNLKSTFLHVIS